MLLSELTELSPDLLVSTVFHRLAATPRISHRSHYSVVSAYQNDAHRWPN
jgi:hypothetical protein